MMGYTDAVLEAIGVHADGGIGQGGEVLRRARQFSVSPLIYSVWKERGVELSEAVQQSRREHIVNIAMLRNEIREVQKLLEPDIRSILLKGEALGLLLYGEPYCRGTGDIDLLVDPENVEEVWRRLESVGYRVDKHEAPRSWTYNQFALTHPHKKITVEIHWALAFPQMPSIPVARLFEQAQEVELAPDLKVLALGPEHLLFHLAYHYHQHEGFLKGLLDIAAWLDRYEATADREEIARIAEELGVSGVLQWPLHVIEKLTGKRSVYYEADVGLAVRLWSDRCAEATRACLVRSDLSQSDRAILRTMARLGKLQGVFVDSMTMLTLDGISPKIVGFMRPWVWGPHRVGRFMYRITRPLVAMERRVRDVF